MNITRLTDQLQYIDFHPPPGTTPKSHPREYFQFAAKAVLSEIHERNYRWTWDHFRQRRDDRLAYIECYVASKLNRASPEQMEKLDALEHKLSYEDLRFYRSLAKNKLRREKAIIGNTHDFSILLIMHQMLITYFILSCGGGAQKEGTRCRSASNESWLVEFMVVWDVFSEHASGRGEPSSSQQPRIRH